MGTGSRTTHHKKRGSIWAASPRKRPKTTQKAIRSVFLEPFRAHRATAASEIVTTWPLTIRNEVRQLWLVRCRSMCVPRFSLRASDHKRSGRRRNWPGPSQPPRRAYARVGAESAPEWPSECRLGGCRSVCGRRFGA